MQVTLYSNDEIKGITSPIIFIGLPDVGLVGSIAVSYIIDKLNMREIGYMDSDLLPPVVLVKDSLVKNPIRLYASNNNDGNNDIIAIISDVPLPSPLAIQFAKSIASWLKGINARLVVNITGIPVQNRLQIDKPQVLYVLTDTDGGLLNMGSTKAVGLGDGIIVGAYAAIIRSCIASKIPTLTLLAQSHLNFPDPFASIEALEVVNKALALDVDLSELKQEAELIRIRTRELMKQTASMLTEAKASPTFYG
jgi:uncharacterized protein